MNQNNYNILKTQELENLLKNQIYEEEFFNIRTITDDENCLFLISIHFLFNIRFRRLS